MLGAGPLRGRFADLVPSLANLSADGKRLFSEMLADPSYCRVLAEHDKSTTGAFTASRTPWGQLFIPINIPNSQSPSLADVAGSLIHGAGSQLAADFSQKTSELAAHFFKVLGLSPREVEGRVSRNVRSLAVACASGIPTVLSRSLPGGGMAHDMHFSLGKDLPGALLWSSQCLNFVNFNGIWFGNLFGFFTTGRGSKPMVKSEELLSDPSMAGPRGIRDQTLSSALALACAGAVGLGVREGRGALPAPPSLHDALAAARSLSKEDLTQAIRPRIPTTGLVREPAPGALSLNPPAPGRPPAAAGNRSWSEMTAGVVQQQRAPASGAPALPPLAANIMSVAGAIMEIERGKEGLRAQGVVLEHSLEGDHHCFRATLPGVNQAINTLYSIETTYSSATGPRIESSMRDGSTISLMFKGSAPSAGVTQNAAASAPTVASASGAPASGAAARADAATQFSVAHVAGGHPLLSYRALTTRSYAAAAAGSAASVAPAAPADPAASAAASMATGDAHGFFPLNTTFRQAADANLHNVGDCPAPPPGGGERPFRGGGVPEGKGEDRGDSQAVNGPEPAALLGGGSHPAPASDGSAVPAAAGDGAAANAAADGVSGSDDSDKTVSPSTGKGEEGDGQSGGGSRGDGGGSGQPRQAQLVLSPVRSGPAPASNTGRSPIHGYGLEHVDNGDAGIVSSLLAYLSALPTAHELTKRTDLFGPERRICGAALEMIRDDATPSAIVAAGLRLASDLEAVLASSVRMQTWMRLREIRSAFLDSLPEGAAILPPSGSNAVVRVNKKSTVTLDLGRVQLDTPEAQTGLPSLLHSLASYFISLSRSDVDKNYPRVEELPSIMTLSLRDPTVFSALDWFDLSDLREVMASIKGGVAVKKHHDVPIFALACAVFSDDVRDADPASTLQRATNPVFGNEYVLRDKAGNNARCISAEAAMAYLKEHPLVEITYACVGQRAL